ncbi:hypothetical protein LJC54_04750 [Parabacteroides sp. OttesenSCG-928-J18]|nr:hypothetical protein [Parabacteroides sp. OttesenSCG-928-J18]
MNDYCWIYITRDPQAGNKLQVAMAIDLPQLLRESSGREVIYYRQFSTTLDAIAHKLLLMNVENETLYYIIRQMNPAMQDLRKDFDTLTLYNI